MASTLTKIIPLSKIQLSRSQLRSKNVAARRKATQTIRRDGQQRPLLIDRDCRLLSGTAPYFALKALNYDLVKAVTLTDASPEAVQAVGWLLDRYEAIRREAIAFNVALASLDEVLEIDTRGLVLDLLPVMIARTGTISIRLRPAMASDDGHHTPLAI